MKDGVPIALGYFAVSFTFGMMAVAGGLSIWQAVLISLTNLTSAGQFAGLDIIFAGGSMWEMAMTQLIINLRYCLMSFSLSQKFRREESGILKYIAAFGITDEIFGISAAQEGKVSVFYNYGAMCVAIPGWTLGTLAGGISGSLLPDFMLSALSVAIYGMFLAIIIPPSKKSKGKPFMSHNVYLYILVMAIVTYLIRMLPLALAKNEIRSPFIKSFLYYVPYACLAAMTFPAILKATDSIISGAAGFLVALIAAYKEKSLITVALLACAAVFIVERVLVFI